MKRHITAGLLMVFTCQSAFAAPKPLAVLCDSAGMKPYSAIRTKLGAGSIYRAGGSFTPSMDKRLCENVFEGRTDLEPNSIEDTLVIGAIAGSSDRNATLGLGLLESIVGAKNKAELKASVQRGDKWSASTGPLEEYGVDALGVMQFIASESDCFNRIRTALGDKKSLEVLLVPRALRTKQIKYSVEGTSGGNAGLVGLIASVLSVDASYKIAKTNANTLDVTSDNYLNICWAKPVKFKLRRDSAVSPRNFVLEPVDPAEPAPATNPS